MSKKKVEVKLTPAEMKLVKSSLRSQPQQKVLNNAFNGDHVRFGYYSDPHVGQKHFIEPLWVQMLKVFKREGIREIYCPGDNLEGMSGRPGHIYELAQIGASAQLEKATELFHQASADMRFYIIDGNHDQWFKEKNNSGLVAGKELAHRNPNVTFLGEWEADVQLHKYVTMKLFHSNDGTA